MNNLIISKHQSEVIEWLRFTLAVLVVFMHTPPGMVNFIDNYHGGILSILYVLIKRGIGSVAVPTFFFISGYLFYCKLEQWNHYIWVSKLRKRIRTILVPYIVWQLIAALFYCLIIFVNQNGISHIVDFCNDRCWIMMFWNCGRFGESTTFITNILGMQMHNSAPIDGPLWFIRDLMVCMLFSPILYYLLKRYILVLLSILLILNIWIP